MSKIKTLKYIVYEAGQVYKGDQYLRTLTESQSEYVNDRNWSSKTSKKLLDRLIDAGDVEFEKAMEVPVVDEVVDLGRAHCNHGFRLLEISSERYKFFCQYCLEVKTIEKMKIPVIGNQ